MNLGFFLKHKKLLGILVILVILGVVFRGRIMAKVAPQPTYKTVTVEKQTLTKTVSASGKIRSDEEVTLKFQTSGYLNWVGVKKGDQVKKWQSIASLDQDQLEKELKQELLDYMNQRWNFEQTQSDYHTGDKTPDEVAVNDDIKRILEKAQFDLNRVVLDVEIKNLALKYATLWTPIDGIVTALDTPTAGLNITPASATFTISNPDKLVFSAKIDEADIGSVKVGQKTKITLDAYPDATIDSTVNNIDFTATLNSSGGTAYEVKFLLPANVEEHYKLGMNGDVTVIVAEEADSLIVPFEAVREKDGTHYVWLSDQGQPKKQAVKIGDSNDESTQILTGVKQGQKVITSGFNVLEK